MFTLCIFFNWVNSTSALYTVTQTSIEEQICAMRRKLNTLSECHCYQMPKVHRALWAARRVKKTHTGGEGEREKDEHHQ